MTRALRKSRGLSRLFASRFRLFLALSVNILAATENQLQQEERQRPPAETGKEERLQDKD